MSSVQLPTLQSFLPGAAATSISIMAGYPADTIKTRMQTGMYKGVFNCISSTVRNEGISALYRGVASPFAMLLLKRSAQFRIYEAVKQNTNSWNAGLIASAIMSPIGNPMHVIKIRMQDSNKTAQKNIFSCIADIARHEGIRGFFKGAHVNFVKDIAFGTMYLGSYGHLKDTLHSKMSSRQADFLAGGIAGSLTWFTLMPIDMIKTAYQSGKGKSFVIDAIKTDGIFKALWRGAIPAVTRVFPTSALSMMVYGLVKDIVS